MAYLSKCLYVLCFLVLCCTYIMSQQVVSTSLFLRENDAKRLSTTVNGTTAIVESPHDYDPASEYFSDLIYFYATSTYYLSFDPSTYTEYDYDFISILHGSSSGDILYKSSGCSFPVNLQVNATSGIVIQLSSDGSRSFWGLLMRVDVSPFFLISKLVDTEQVKLCSLSTAMSLDKIGWLCSEAGYPIGNPCSDDWSHIRCDNDTAVSICLHGLHLTGVIAPEISFFSNLFHLNLDSNYLSGTIPEQLFTLTSLKYVAFDNLHGSISTNFSKLVFLNSLDLDNNSFTGTIPEAIFTLTNLQSFYLYNNRLNGSISPDFSKLAGLNSLDLARNSFTGTIPEAIFTLTNLQGLYLFNNRLNGSISSDFNKLTDIRDLCLQYNNFTGSMPLELYQMTNLEALILNNNFLTGQILPEVGAWMNMKSLSLYENPLGGTIPTEISKLWRLETLLLSKNSLQGLCPVEIFNMTALVDLDLASNSLEGSIPTSVSNLRSLNSVSLSSNKLKGEIPSAIFDLTGLSSLDLSSNEFTGQLPPVISSPRLSIMILRNNSLSGSVSDLNITCPLLALLDLSSNQFRGSFPSNIFTLPSLETLAASSNCIRPYIADTVCGARRLKNLFFNGLNLNTRYVYIIKITRNFMQHYKTVNYIALNRCGASRSQEVGNHLPDCILSLESIEKLYLIGNGFLGDFGAMHNRSSKLRELSINSNRIAGSLPANILNNHSYSVFDISNNQITGYLDQPIFALTSDRPTEYHANVNRLSGALSVASINEFSTVNILNGNIFSCETIPAVDSNVNMYSCGSLNFEVSIYTWLICLALSFVSLCFVQYYPGADVVKAGLAKLKSFASTDVLTQACKASIPKTAQFIATLSKISEFTVRFSAFLVVSTVVVYSCLKLSSDSELYRTHTEQYWHTVSGLYLKSETSASCLLALYILAIAMLLHSYSKLFSMQPSAVGPGKELKRRKQVEKRGFRQIAWEYSFQAFGVISFLGVSFVINGAYIYIRVQYDGDMIILVQAAYLLLTLLYKQTCLPLLMSYLFRTHQRQNRKNRRVVITYTAVVAIVDIIMPCFATLFTSDLCFRQLFVEGAPVESSYSYTYSIMFDGRVNYLGTRVVSDSINSTFFYSNQCRNAVIQSFLPIIIYSSAYSTFIYPMFYIIATWGVNGLSAQRNIFGVPVNIRWILLPDVTYSFIMICNDVLLLLLYGLISPLCASALGMSIVSQLYLLRVSIVRCYHMQLGCETADPRDAGQIESTCERTQRFFYIVIWPGLAMASLLFAILLYDMARDSDNKSQAGPAVIVSTQVAASIMVWYVLRVKPQHPGSEIKHTDNDDDKMSSDDISADGANPIHLFSMTTR